MERRLAGRWNDSLQCGHCVHRSLFTEQRSRVRLRGGAMACTAARRGLEQQVCRPPVPVRSRWTPASSAPPLDATVSAVVRGRPRSVARDDDAIRRSGRRTPRCRRSRQPRSVCRTPPARRESCRNHCRSSPGREDRPGRCCALPRWGKRGRSTSATRRPQNPASRPDLGAFALFGSTRRRIVAEGESW